MAMKWFRFLLFPFALVYHCITKTRNIFFDFGIFNQKSFSIPVIIVGNLSVGGTGKTPQIEYLIRLLKKQCKIAVLSRGYKRKSKGFIRVSKNDSADKVGDEPLQFAKKFKDIFVAVDANRVEGIQKIVNQYKPNIILLDDAYQHRKVKGSYYVLLTKYEELFTNDFLLPMGNLRESSSGAFRTDVIIITKCPENLTKKQQDIIKNKMKKYQKPVLFSTISYSEKLKGTHEISVNELMNFDILLITGIANPNALIRFFTERNLSFEHLNFPDHHQFNKKDIDFIQSKFESIKSVNKIIITTEKDYVRLHKKIQNCYFLEIETKFLNHQNKIFESLIWSHIHNFEG